MARVTVEGVVASVNGTGTGFRVEEGFEIDGKRYRRFFSCWFPKSATVAVPNTGDHVTVTGTLSAKVARDPRYVDLTINNARLEQRTQPASDPAPEDTPPEDPWGPVAHIPDGETPF
jgi:hypothetical protein